MPAVGREGRDIQHLPVLAEWPLGFSPSLGWQPDERRHRLEGRIAGKGLLPRGRRLQKKISKLGIATQSASKFESVRVDKVFEPAARLGSGLVRRLCWLRWFAY